MHSYKHSLRASSKYMFRINAIVWCGYGLLLIVLGVLGIRHPTNIHAYNGGFVCIFLGIICLALQFAALFLGPDWLRRLATLQNALFWLLLFWLLLMLADHLVSGFPNGYFTLVPIVLIMGLAIHSRVSAVLNWRRIRELQPPESIRPTQGPIARQV